jgi:hypothetical protein
MKRIKSKAVALCLVLCFVVFQSFFAAHAADETSSAGSLSTADELSSTTEPAATNPLMHIENITIAQGLPYDLTAYQNANTVMALTEGTIIVRY